MEKIQKNIDIMIRNIFSKSTLLTCILLTKIIMYEKTHLSKVE